MSIDTVKEHIPEYAKDLKLNLTTLIREQDLPKEAFWGVVLTTLHTIGNTKLLQDLSDECNTHLSEEYQTACKIAVSLMGMNNIYYRFTHFCSNTAYHDLPARLRMNGLRGHGIPQKHFELFSLAASAITGCGLCVDQHEIALRKEGVTEKEIQAAVKVSAVLHGIALTYQMDDPEKKQPQ
ncbi:carboxymuconolactone decarboxylase family protein [bacterium]|nr:carboxymuconolactone decarboxylase family protein [bacterium]